jgi:hypothetical protein
MSVLIVVHSLATSAASIKFFGYLIFNMELWPKKEDTEGTRHVWAADDV